MIRRTQYNFFMGMTGALCLLLLPGMAHAQITVTPTVTQIGSLYHYDYAITNPTADDMLVLDIKVLPGVGVVSGVGAPSGFMSAYDSGLGLVSFLEDTANFGPTPTNGFVYDSVFAPQPSSFVANTVNSINGISPAPTGSTVAAVPEPGTLAMLSAVGLVSGFALRRRRNR